MFSLLFRNRWFALAWVGLMLLSVSMFAGKDGGAEQLTRTMEQVRAHREEAQRPVVSAPVAVRAPDVPKPVIPPLRRIPGSSADPASPKVGDVFIDPATGQRVRAVRRSEYEATPAHLRPRAGGDLVPSKDPL